MAGIKHIKGLQVEEFGVVSGRLFHLVRFGVRKGAVSGVEMRGMSRFMHRKEEICGVESLVLDRRPGA